MIVVFLGSHFETFVNIMVILFLGVSKKRIESWSSGRASRVKQKEHS
jgi:hypothetical protein